MPRVSTHKKSRGGKSETFRCAQCPQPIEPGQTYYQWEFRYGGKQRQHTTHGYPKQSQLTQSKMAEVYSAAEDLEGFSVEPLSDDVPQGEWMAHFEGVRSDAESALTDAADNAQGVADEYQDAIDAMPASEEQNQERIDAIEEWISELQDAESDVGAIEPDDPEDIDSINAALEEIQTRLSDAAGQFAY